MVSQLKIHDYDTKSFLLYCINMKSDLIGKGKDLKYLLAQHI